MRVANNRSNIERHNRRQSHKTSFQCSVCYRYYKTATLLAAHRRIHKKQYVCHLCGNRYGRTDVLQTHLESHLKTKNYKCEFCGRMDFKSTHYYHVRKCKFK